MSGAAIAGALAVGLSLGLTGAGGSILILPVLVYLAGVPVGEAVGLSLFVVGLAAAVGAIERGRAGDLDRRMVLSFGIGGAVGAPLGSRLTEAVPEAVLMGIFSVLMIVVAGRMWATPSAVPEERGQAGLGRVAAAGLGTGMLTGFLGVGGGFLLVPALLRFGHLDMRRATGTSLAVIAINSAVGWLAHWPQSGARPGLMLLFGGLAVVGILIGRRLATRLGTRHLRRGFAIMVLVAGGLVLWQSLAD